MMRGLVLFLLFAATISAFQVDVLRPFSNANTSADFKFYTTESGQYTAMVIISKATADVKMDGTSCTFAGTTYQKAGNYTSSYNCSRPLAIGWNYPKIVILFADDIPFVQRDITVQFMVGATPVEAVAPIPKVPVIPKPAVPKDPIPTPVVAPTPVVTPKPEPAKIPIDVPPLVVSNETSFNETGASIPSTFEFPSYTPFIVIVVLACLSVGAIIFYIKGSGGDEEDYSNPTFEAGVLGDI